MDEREAIQTLAKNLAELGYVNFVEDSSIKSNILTNSKHVILPNYKKILEPIVTQATSTNGDFYKYRNDALEFRENTIKSLKSNSARGANYIFLIHEISCGVGAGRGPYNSTEYKYLSRDLIVATPIALVGELEEKILKQTFYKDVPEEVSEAMKTLKIESFEEPFKLYQNNKIINNSEEIGVIGVGDVIQGRSTGRYYKVKAIKKYMCYGPQFRDKELTQLTNCDASCEFSAAKIVRKGIFHTAEFCNFVFTLPLEDQNIEANKKILELSAEKLDYEKILSQTYQNNPNLFKQYFLVLKDKHRTGVVKKLQTLGKQDSELNSWLFHQGFVKGEYLKHIMLYLNKPLSFEKLFTSAKNTEKAIILQDIYNLKDEQTNLETNKWLSQNYPKLVETIGRDRITKKMEEENGRHYD